MWNCKIMDIHDINTVWIWYDTNRYVVCVRVINSSIRASQRTGGGKWHACSHSGESLRYFYDRLGVHPVELMDEVVREVTEVAAVEVTGGAKFCARKSNSGRWPPSKTNNNDHFCRH